MGGDAVGVGKVGSIRGNPSVYFLLPEPPLAESSARSGRGGRLQPLSLSQALSLQRCRGLFVKMESPPPPSPK